MVSIVNLIGLGAVVVVGILIFTQFQKLGGFLSQFKLPEFPEITLPEINILGPEITDPRSLNELGLVGPLPDTPQNIIGPQAEKSQGIGLAGAIGDRLRNVIKPKQLDKAVNPPLPITAGSLEFLVKQGLFGQPKTAQTTEKMTEIEQPVEVDIGGGFVGGGPSFIGGDILPLGTGQDIGKLSLSEIIERFGVTASQAANIRGIARDDFGDFDFGTNLGFGIGSVTKEGEISTLLPSPASNISDSQFQGLSLQEIANRLTGGNIQNFA